MRKTRAWQCLAMSVLAAILAGGNALGQTTGFNQTSAGPHDYNTGGNWVGGTINGIWDPSLTLAAGQTVTFASGTSLGTGLTFDYAGNLALTLWASAAGTQTITLGGNISLNTLGGTTANVTIGNSANHLDVDLGGVTRTMTVSASRTLTLVDVVSNGGLTKAGAGTLTLTGVNTYSGATKLMEGTLTLSGTGSILNSAITFNGGALTLSYADSDSEKAYSRVHDTTGITANGGTLTYTTTTAGSTKIFAETIGSVALTSGQLNIVESLNKTAGSQTLTLAGLTRTGASNSSAITFSAATTGPQASGNRNMIVVTSAGSTGANQIIGPWATVGTAANAQTDYAVYSSDYVIPASIAGSAETTWTTAANAYTLSIPAKTAVALTATRNIAALKVSSTATPTTSNLVNGSPNFNISSGTSLNVGDPVVLSSFGGKITTFTAGTVYYVASTTATTFTLAATPGGAAINAGSAVSSLQFTGGLKLDSGINLGTTGILNSGNAPLAIGRTATGGHVTLPTAGAGNLYITTGLPPNNANASGLAGRIVIESPIVDNGGTLTLVKNGGGTLRLQGSNTYTGGTVINAGTVMLTDSANVGTAGITFNGSGALSFGPNLNFDFASAGTINLARPIALNNGAIAGFYYNSPGTTMNISGAITGDGGIISGKDPVITYSGGDGTIGINFTSTGNTFTGPLTINNATATFNSLADSSSPIILNSGFTYGSGAAANMSVPNRLVDVRASSTIANSSGSRTVTLGAVSTTTSGAKTLTLGNGGAGGFVAGNITNGSGTIAVTKSGSGTWTLSGTNTYTGATTISGGTLAINSITNVNGGASAVGAPTTVANGTIAIGATTTAGTLVYTGTGHTSDRVINLAGTTGGATLDQSGSGLLKFTSAFTATGAGAKTLTLQGSTSGVGEIAGAIVNSSSATSLAKSGTGTWVLSGANGYTGATAINGGVLGIGANAPSGSAGALGNAATEVTLGVAGGNVDAGILIGGAYTVGRIIRIPTSNTTDSGTRVLTLGGSTADNSEFSGAIKLGSDSQAGRGVTLTAIDGGQVTFSGVIQNPSGMDATTYTVTKSGAGTVVLSNANTYTGATTVNDGTLKLGADNVFADTMPLSIGNATLDAATFTDTVGTLDVTGTATINLGTDAALAFDNSSGIIWTGDTLTLTGTLVSGSSLRFGTTSGGLTGTQLALISMSGWKNFALNSNGFLTADEAVSPTVENVTSAKANGTYNLNAVIDVTVQFSEPVDVTGIPQLTLETGGTDRTADCIGGSGTDTLTFRYTVQLGDTSSDLDYTTTGALALNGGTIQDAALNDATLTLPDPGAASSLGANKALVILASVSGSTFRFR